MNNEDRIVSDLENGFELNILPVPPNSEYKGRVRNGDTERLGVLTTQIQGHRYQTKAYYQQYLGADDTTDDFKPSSMLSVDQYIKIRNIVLILSSPMPAYSVNADTGLAQYTGTATTPCHFLPNKGDLFVATVDTGRDYIFEVTSKPERMTVFEQAAYTFNFSSLYDATEIPARLQALEEKVVLRKVYVPELTTYSEKSILLENEYETYKGLSKHRYYLANEYQTSFMNNDVHSLLLPAQEAYVYDSDAVNAFIAICNMNDYGETTVIEKINCKDDILREYKTIWNLLREAHGDPSRLAVKKFGMVDKNNYTSRAWFRSVRFSGVKYVYTPRGCLDNAKLYSTGRAYDGPKLKPSLTTIDGMEIVIKTFEGGTNLPYIIPVTEDDYYIFSESFYKDKIPLSHLEYLVLSMLKGETIQPETLLKLCDSAIDWGELEYYYYVPVLLYLIEWAFKHGFY